MEDKIGFLVWILGGRSFVSIVAEKCNNTAKINFRLNQITRGYSPLATKISPFQGFLCLHNYSNSFTQKNYVEDKIGFLVWILGGRSFVSNVAEKKSNNTAKTNFR